MKLHQLVFFRSPMVSSEVVGVTEIDGTRKLPRRIPRAACRLLLWGWAMLSLCTPAPTVARPTMTIFESGQVRPLALSPSGTLLFAVNTPDNRLEIFAVRPHGLRHRASVPVGLEPVAVAARTDDEVWVVNHLSDSVSIVDIDDGGARGRVVRTLLVGDEPRDIVFAGPGKSRAFITTAHRGQNHPHDPQLTTPGIGRADVWVFAAQQLDSTLGGTPLNILTLFTDTPRALAVTPDGRRVYAAGFHSGNQTTVITELNTTFNPMGLIPPGPFTNSQLAPAPAVSVIVKWNGSQWVDELGQDWSDQVKLSLSDKDVHVIDAMANPPQQLAGSTGFYTGVGTILFNMVVNPANGNVYVSNTEAFNHKRFEGPGIFAGDSLRGHLHESRITVLGTNGSVAPRHLNKHIDYASCCAPVPNAESETSLAQPNAMAITRDGATLYVAALGSSKIGVYDTQQLEDDAFVPSQDHHIEVSGGGPTGLVLDSHERRLFVLTRFDNAITVVDTTSRREVGKYPLYNPEPDSVRQGRRFFYDARHSSAHGDSSCASCHIFGDFDSLAWDLGNPDAAVTVNPGPFLGPLINLFTHQPMPEEFHPMKGPMTTQSLRGMLNAGPMHWRGDRTAGTDEPTVQPDGGSFNEAANFKKFQAGFTDLLGRSEVLADEDMDAFANFILQVTYPPNPIRALDNGLTAAQVAGRGHFFNVIRDGTNTCNGCHALNPQANPTSQYPGFFGTAGDITFDFQPQLIKTPHLRNLYQKVGMFGMAAPPFGILPGDNLHKGDQVRGFGFLHDGSFDTLFRFMRGMGFSPFEGITIPEGTFPDNPDGIEDTPAGDLIRRHIEAFLLVFDSNMAPIVGQQVTLSAATATAATPRIALLMARADAGDCELVAKGTLAGHSVGFLYAGHGRFQSDRHAVPPVPEVVLRSLGLLPRHEITYTCAPLGSGRRIGIDRDEDGVLDGDEADAGSDPANPDDPPTGGSK
jgi:DNA-binding beta-propeller fold protein YncE